LLRNIHLFDNIFVIIIKYSSGLRILLYLCTIKFNALSLMEKNKDLNRIKVMLAEKKRTNKWLAEQLGKDPATISKWVTNVSQPSLENLIEISRLLEVDIKELIRVNN